MGAARNLTRKQIDLILGGTLSDKILAERLGVTTSAISKYRARYSSLASST